MLYNHVFYRQTRAVGLNKQIYDAHEQVEQSQVELKTFETLRTQELKAIPKRLEVCTVVITFHHKWVFNTVFHKWICLY